MSRIILEPIVSGELETVVFDFTSRLTPAETLSTAVTTAVVYSGTDASPSAIISGSASISGQKVSQKITTVSVGVLGVTYDLVCTVTTSLGQTLKLSAFLTIVPAYA